MKFSVKTWILVGLLVAAIGYTIYNWVIGGIDADTAILYILVLSFPMVRMLNAALQTWKNSAE
jgi:hypothetical protein